MQLRLLPRAVAQALISISLLTLSMSVSAAKAPRYIEPETQKNRWYWGGSLGYYDADYNDAFINAGTVGLFAGVQFNRYLGLELRGEQFFDSRYQDERGIESTFEALLISPSLVARYQLDHDASAFIRLGVSHLDYQTEREGLLPLTEATTQQFMFGAGLRLGRLSAEYVNYGKFNELDLEQLRMSIHFNF